MPAGPEGCPRQAPAPHEARAIAESFGLDPQRYDQARPSYPRALIQRVVEGSPGRDCLDVGCGTGIAARQFEAAGCRVLGVEPDPRMAQFARDRGLPVELATFEAWKPAGRSFDLVIAAQSWHWVDPVAGTVKAAQVLRPGGRLALFGHVFEPPSDIAESLAAACRERLPESPFTAAPARRPLELYQVMYTNFADSIRKTRLFDEPEQWQFEWQQRYTRDQWLELLPTTGGLTQVAPATRAEILEAVGRTIDALGGHFTMEYRTLATTALRA